MSIKRVWHGWTTLEDADAYQDILLNKVIPGIEAKKISGLRKFEVLRIAKKDEVEFVTMMTYDSLEDVIGLQGKDYKKCYVPDVAQQVLKRWDQKAIHYELIDTIDY
ncbi:MAG: antibiotic biosynthesis monooxygenase [Puniceicoccaceae bacterium]